MGSRIIAASALLAALAPSALAAQNNAAPAAPASPPATPPAPAPAPSGPGVQPGAQPPVITIPPDQAPPPVEPAEPAPEPRTPEPEPMTISPDAAYPNGFADPEDPFGNDLSLARQQGEGGGFNWGLVGLLGLLGLIPLFRKGGSRTTRTVYVDRSDPKRVIREEVEE